VRLRSAFIATAAWTVLAFGVSAVALWYVLSHAPPSDRDRRAGLLGQGAGTVMALGYAAIWLPYAYQVGRRRREQRERERRREGE
jgi:hypothetical protein